MGRYEIENGERLRSLLVEPGTELYRVVVEDDAEPDLTVAEHVGKTCTARFAKVRPEPFPVTAI